jgi:bifunctional DNA-binding transcriptional regulator/antitoxin component of YhaV-PrlF toxin-antitoxin module
MKRTLKVTSKGQVTLPAEMLDQLGVRPGGKITAEFVAPGRAEVHAAQPGAGLERFVGCLKGSRGRRLSVKDMQEVVRGAWAGKT